jgi:MFS family permease
MVVTALFPFMKTDLGLSDTQLGLLVSVIFWSVTIFALPAAYVLDRWSRKKGIGISVILWSIACAAIGFLKSFPAIFSIRAVMGIGEATYNPGGIAMISAFFPENKRAQMNGILNAAVPIGAIAGSIVGGVIAESLGWRYAFGIVAIPGIIFGLLFFTLKDYKTIELTKTITTGLEAGKKVKMKINDIAKEFFSKPSLITNYFGYVGSVFVTTALMTWLPTYFYKLMDKPDMAAASLQAAAIFLMAMIGAPIGGIVTDLVRKRVKRARMLVPTVSATITAILLFFAFNVPPGTAQYLLLLSMGFFAPFFVAGAASVTQDVVHPGLRSTSYGLGVLIQNLLGASLGPIFVGAISDRINLLTGLQLLSIFLVFAGAMFFIGSFFYNRDSDRVEHVVVQAE